LRFQLHPGAVLVDSKYPVFKIWQMSTAADLEEQVDLDAGPDRLLVIRRSMMAEIEPLTPAEWIALQALAADAALADAHAQAVAIDVAFDLALFLQRHVAGQTIVSFQSPPPHNHTARPT
jgi:hypothetical protein